MPGIDAPGDLVVLERHLPVDVLEPPGPVGVPHPSRVLVATQVAVRDGDPDEARVLLQRANREVQDTDREAGRQEQFELGCLGVRLAGAAYGPSDEAVAWRGAVIDPDVHRVGLPDPDLRMGAVDDLRRAPEARLPHGEALGPELLAGPGDELRPRGRDEPEPLGNRLQHLLEGPRQRPPELVVVVVDHPIRAELIRLAGEHRPTRRPRVAGVSLDVVELDQPGLAVRLQDLEGAVGRPVVADQEEIDALRPVVAQIRLDQVLGVADEDGHRKAHGPTPSQSLPRPAGTITPAASSMLASPVVKVDRGSHPTSA